MLANNNNNIIDSLAKQSKFVYAYTTLKVALEANNALMDTITCSRLVQLALLTKDLDIMEEAVRFLLHDDNKVGASVLMRFKSQLPNKIYWLVSVLVLSILSRNIGTHPSYKQCTAILRECTCVKDPCVVNELSSFFMNEHVVNTLATHKYSKEESFFLCQILRIWVEWNQYFWAKRYFDTKIQFKDNDSAEAMAAIYSWIFTYFNSTTRAKTKTRHCNACHKTGVKSKNTFGKCPHCLGFYFCSYVCELNHFQAHYKSKECECIRHFTQEQQRGTA